jgi:uncharacterized protein with HEPN domain
MRDKQLLLHILDQIRKIETYSGDIDLEGLESDELKQAGLLRFIEIIGEASSRLSADLRNQNATIPWQDIVGMRNKLIHEYFGVNLEFVWYTIKYDIPILKEQISQILESIE